MLREPETAPSRLRALCDTVRSCCREGNYDKCRAVICASMEEYPDAPEPHNLLGVLLEQEGKHGMAMRHFRAALDLEPSYLPARHNLEHYGTFFTEGSCAFDESDCPKEKEEPLITELDERGICHVIRRDRT